MLTLSCRRVFGSAFLLTAILCLADMLPSRLSGQAPAKKPPTEEEDPNPPKKKAVPKVEDDDVTPSKGTKPGDRRRPAILADLGREAEKSRNLDVVQLFSELAIEHDVAIMLTEKLFKVEPVSVYVGPKNPQFKGKIELSSLSGKGANRTRFTVTNREILGIIHFEEVALNEVDAFLRKVPAEAANNPDRLQARLDAFQKAEKALTAVIAFHQSAREREIRDSSPGWRDLEKRLLDKLRSVQIRQLHALGDAKDWDEAFSLISRLLDSPAKNDEVQNEVAHLLSRHAEHALKSDDIKGARQRLQLLEQQFPTSKAAEIVRDGLRAKAKALFEEALELKRANKRQEALGRLSNAEGIWPQLPGLRDEILRLKNEYPILMVGVRDLPKFLSPATACTDSERRAVELLFEGLVEQVTTDPSLGSRFVPELAADAPRLLPRGRLFELDRQAFWSDGRPVTAADVSFTQALLGDRNWPGRVQGWAELMEQPRIEGDAYHVHLGMTRGYLEPLGLMNFKILPQSAGLDRPDNKGFAQKPLGSGPYMFEGIKGGQAIFVANPYYGARPGKVGLPRIREIRFVQPKDPVQELLTGQLHLLVDVPTALYKTLKSAQLPTANLTNRRVYFLAVNHRLPLLQTVEVRRAIGHAIDREAILNQCFRGEAKEYHRPLNGPYPPDSWVYNPQVKPADPHQPELAATLAKAAKIVDARLTVKCKYPDNDPQVKRACEQMREQVRTQTGVTLELIPLSPHQLHDDVVRTHDYELAYFHHDYPTDAHWLWPLFDPKAMEGGGLNYLGYQNDGRMGSLFNKTLVHRDVRVVQEASHEIHRQVFEKMPLIPLWQLDTHLAWHKSLKTASVDPLLIFNQVELWQLESK